MFGTPEHPLTRDLDFGGAYFSQEKVDSKAVPNQRTSGASFVLGSTGKIVVHSANPAKARVLFQPRSKDLPVSQYVLPKDLWKLCKQAKNKLLPPDPALWDEAIVPKGVVALFLGETDFNGVVFDGFYKEGIIVSDVQRKAWKNVTFGQKNQGKPEELFRKP